jgi:glycosyltransferase involved in cell wall biosynthesis
MRVMRRRRIIYIAPNMSSFVRKDITFLSETSSVLAPEYDWTNKFLVPISLLRQLFFLLWQVPRSKVTFVMFGGYWSLLPALVGRLLRKPVYIIAGGTDCVSFPSLGYGSLRKPTLRRVIKWSYTLCTRILPVDESLVFCEYSWLKNRDYDFQGYRWFFPRLKTEHTVVHNGFDASQFEYNPRRKQPGTFVTIASADDMRRFIIKGIDKILEIAPSFPHCTFRVAGVSEELNASLSGVPQNVHLMPFLPPAEFREIIAESEFCLHLSVSEGFPNALCEAMLGGCIPIVSSVGAMPFIVGETGFVAESSDTAYLCDRITTILTTTGETKLKMASAARARVAELFPIEKRRQAFLALVETAG